MINAAKFSVDESSLRYQARTKLAELANEISSSRNLNKVEDKVLLATKIRLWLKALDYKDYLTREQREKIWYALIDLSGIYDFPVAPVLSNMPRPNILIGGGGNTGSVSEWGDIGGTLSNQLDLQAALDAKVDISGDTMTGDLGFTGAGINSTDYVQFNTAYAGAIPEGRLAWNPTDGRLEVGLPGSNILGDTSPGFVRVVNKTGVTIPRGKIVYINGGQGNRPTITLASNTSEGTSARTFGITLESLANNNNGYVLKFGFLYDVNTSSFSAGQTIYLGTAGDWTGTKPVAPNHMVAVGKVVNVSATVGTVYVDIQNGFELEELHNVLITSVQNGDVLTYDSSTSLWKNLPVSGGHIIQDEGVSETQRAKLNFQRMLVTDDSVNNATVVKRPADTSISTTAPASPLEGDEWTDSSTMKTYKYYDSYWVEISSVVTGTLTGSGVANELTYWTAPSAIASLTTATYPSLTELSYVKGVTSAIQTQLNARPTGSGTSGQVAYWSGTSTQTGSSTFTFSPTAQLLVNNSVTAAGAIARGINFTPTLTAAANNDVLVGLDINPTFTNGAFTGVANYPLRVVYGANSILSIDNTPAFIIGSGASSGNASIDIKSSGRADLYLRSGGSANLSFNIYTFGGNYGSNYAQIGTNDGINSASQGGAVYFDSRTGTAPPLRLMVKGTGTTTMTNAMSVFNTGNIAINSSTDSGYKLDVNGLVQFKGTTASDGGQLGSELLSTANWTSTGWTGSFGAGWTHTIGNTTALTNTLAAVNGNYYLISYTVTGRTAGTFVIAFGGYTSSSISATGNVGPRATLTGTLSITPTTDFDGTIVISIKQITTGSASVTLSNSSGTITNELSSIRNDNLFIGTNSGKFVTTIATDNYAFGRGALYQVTTGSGNVAIGRDALVNITWGYQNTAIGYRAGNAGIVNDSAVAVGYDSANSNTRGTYVSIGHFSGRSNTTGIFWVATGRSAGFSNQTGSSWTAIGDVAGYSNTNGSSWIALGQASGYSNGTDSNWIAIGQEAARYYSGGTTAATSFSNGVYIGTTTKVAAAAATNEIVIGYQAEGIGSNTAVIGNTSITATYLRGNINYTDGGNFVIGTTTGTKIGTSTSQKIGFYNATPVVQPTAVTTSQGIADALSSLGLLASSSISSVPDVGGKLYLFNSY